MQHKVNIEVKITSAEIDHIICTAIEGGINYWCESYYGSGGDFSLLPENQVAMKYEWEHLVYGGYLTMDEDGNIEHKLDQESFMKGLQMWIDKHPSSVDIVSLPNKYTTINTGQIDADDADCIVQYALFGELKYC
ncbi:MAG: hypothetical protein CMM25_06095 [Rhodospirillaceae bacterium]|nr:hypothetical protein [Rhodospirillaceae bacterium]